MFKSNFIKLFIIPIALLHSSANADETVNDFYVKKGVTLLSGDTWRQDEVKYQLYGVQSCLRGTSFINAANQQLDCGEASMKILASFFKDVPTICRPILSSDTTTYVNCKIKVDKEIVDLGTALISIGFHFAARDFKQNTPLNITYQAAEKNAFKTSSGLWNYNSFPHPVEILKTQGNHNE
ncbi:MAG: thermonuclease family protein [Rhizobiales bacterium]|nr:thermonuclease family protein [Hyphomicrobiales bacterium]